MNFYLKMALKIYYLDKSREKNVTKVFLLRVGKEQTVLKYLAVNSFSYAPISSNPVFDVIT